MNPTELHAAASSALPRLHTPDEVAEALGVSGWWVREQARQHRIPFTKVGGAYRFSAQHVTEIIRIFEDRPDRSAGRTAASRAGRRRTHPQPPTPTIQLKARMPRRIQTRGGDDAS